MAYAAYLGVYEPVPAFREPDRSRWSAVTAPRVAVPERESEHAYIRRACRTVISETSAMRR
jgi:hypothetical protein